MTSNEGDPGSGNHVFSTHFYCKFSEKKVWLFQCVFTYVLLANDFFAEIWVWLVIFFSIGALSMAKSFFSKSK